MSFLSFNFAVFVGLALLLFHLSPPRWRPGLLLGFSYLYYLSWSWGHTLLLAGVTAAVYAAALWIERCPAEKGKSRLMALGVAMLLVLLFAFKSADWLLGELWPKGGAASTSLAAVLIVPLGLSYYIFKMLGYLLDVYWETLPAQRNPVYFALYCSFFPQIVSGPIQRAENFFSQLGQIRHPAPDQFQAGLRRILFGLFKKVAIADSLAMLAASVHGNPSGFSSLELLLGAYAYSLQLYTDFSGITDIAIGLGQLFGVKGPENFELPFFAPDLQMFWRRWHMSLTTWLTDYLFMPLRMSLRALGTPGLCLAIFINMVAIGLWHGLSWTYLAFGVLNGLFMTVSALTLKQRHSFFKTRPALARLRTVAGPLLTFHLVVLTHVFFRAESFPAAMEFLRGLALGWRNPVISPLRLDWPLLGITAGTLAVCILGFLGCEAVTWASRQRRWVDRFFAAPLFCRQAAYCATAAVVLFLFKGSVSFIYAHF